MHEVQDMEQRMVHKMKLSYRIL